MNEPSVFNDIKTMPIDTVHRDRQRRFPRTQRRHAEIHNVYGMRNAARPMTGSRRCARTSARS